jgi:DNA-binding transcriptional MerR regulator
MTPETNEPRPAADNNLDDDHYPAFTMGRAAEMLGTTPGFLRGLDEAKLIEPERSSGGHRRYSRYQLRLASRVRELVDQGMSLDAACRIVTLEDQLQEARDLNKQNAPPEPDQPYPPLRGV